MNTEVLYPTIQEERFNEMIIDRSGQPFLVVFTADWLGEGTIMDSIIGQLAEEYHDRFGFCRVDIEVSKKLSRQLGIRRLPTILFLLNGELIDQVQGMKSKRILKDKIEGLLEKIKSSTEYW